MTRPAALLLLLALALAGCSGGVAEPAGDGGEPTGPPVIDLGQGKGAIDGVVANEAVAPIAGAIVVLQPLNVSAVTTADGRFAFDGLEPGAYVVNATHADYKGAQATVQVGAGDPTPARVLLAALRNLSPNVVRDGESLLVSSSFCVATYCNKVFSGNQDTFRTHDLAYFEVDDRPTTMQVEVTWDATVATLGEAALLECSAYGDDPEGSTSAARYDASGPAPLTLRMPGTFADGGSGAPVHANSLTCELSAANGDAPAGALVQQQAELYVHYFYNFVPDEGWTFIADGDYPVPP